MQFLLKLAILIVICSKKVVMHFYRLLPNISLVLRSTGKKGSNNHTIYLQIRQKGNRRGISLNIQIEKKYWTGMDSMWITKSHPESKKLNLFLEQQLCDARAIFLDYFSQGKAVSFIGFKQSFLTPPIPIPSEKDYWAKVHSLFCALKNKRVKQETLNHYEVHFKKLLAYAPDLKIKDVNLEFLMTYELHLKEKHGNAINTIRKNMVYMKQILNYAVSLKVIEYGDNPFRFYVIRSQKPKPLFLNFEELEKLQSIYDKAELEDRLQNVLQYFLFACYTGMDLTDLTNFLFSDIERFGEWKTINRRRAKTDDPYYVPIIDQAINLLPEQGYKKQGDMVFRIISGQKTNTYLKEIMKFAGIHKNISFHKARHTFATLSANLGIPEHLIQHAMGHTDPRMTRQYTHVVTSSLFKEFKKWH